MPQVHIKHTTVGLQMHWKNSHNAYIELSSGYACKIYIYRNMNEFHASTWVKTKNLWGLGTSDAQHWGLSTPCIATVETTHQWKPEPAWSVLWLTRASAPGLTKARLHSCIHITWLTALIYLQRLLETACGCMGQGSGVKGEVTEGLLVEQVCSPWLMAWVILPKLDELYELYN